MSAEPTVRVRRRSDEPLRTVAERYGDADGLVSALERHLLAAEGRARRGELLPPAAEEVAPLRVLLHDAAAYGALGEMGNADRRALDAMLPLLTRLTKAALLGGFEAAAAGDGDDDGGTDALLEGIARAISNCSAGVSCRAADCVLELRPAGAAPLSVGFGFADYSAGETGAMLWAGAVGLSAFLAEHGEEWVWGRRAIEGRGRDPAGVAPLRVIELGCGPAVVSLVAAALLCATGPPLAVRLDVTDISPEVVEEARRSFATRNEFNYRGRAVSVTGGDDEDGDDGDGDDAADAVQEGGSLAVHAFCLDFAAVAGSALCGAYDVVLASDVVYDYRIAQHVAPAVELLLREGGIALLCCETHRDGMEVFVARIQSHAATTALEVVADERDVQSLLSTLRLPDGLSASSCRLIALRKLRVPQ